MEQQQQEGNTYRGIKLAESVKLYGKNGEYNKSIKRGLDEFADLLENNGHKLLSCFEKNANKVLIDFNCGHETHMINPNDYKRGRGCPRCGNAMKNKERSERSKVEFEALIKRNNHKLLSEYTANNIKVLIDFKCEHGPHMISPNHYKKGKGCPKCSGNCPEQAENDLLIRIEQNGHVLLSAYKDNKTKVKIDFKCNHEPHWIRPNRYKQGDGCPKCAGICTTQAKVKFIKLLEQKGHTWVDGEYKSNKIPVQIDFNCGHKPQWITPNNYTKHRSCYECGRKGVQLAIDKRKMKSKEEFEQLVKKNGHQWMTGEYVNNFTKVGIDYGCGHGTHEISPNHYKREVGCPYCNESKGEKAIREWFEKQGIPHYTQYIFHSQSKRFDFFLPVDNLIVEVHGIQHYDEIELFSNRTLEEEQANDQLKKDFVENLGFKYIAVDYREGKPKLALERFIEAYNKLKTESTAL